MKKIVVLLFLFIINSCFPTLIYKKEKKTHSPLSSVLMLGALDKDGDIKVGATGFAVDENFIATAGHFCLDVTISAIREELTSEIDGIHIDSQNNKVTIKG